MLGIDVVKLTHCYNSHPAVDEVSFQVAKSEIFGLLGPNGAGKSTTLKMLTTLLPPTSGSAKIMGLDIEKEPAKVRGEIGYVPQLLSADGDLTGYENLLLAAKLYGMRGKSCQEQILEVLEFLGLAQVKDVLVRHYSGGMIRRLEIGQALVHKPHVLFLDEPASGLDPAARKTLWQHLLEWRSQYHTTILITTHDMEEADTLCDRVAFMYEGKIVLVGSPAELKAGIGETATLNDVFIACTGNSINDTGDYRHAAKIRQVLSRRK